MINSSNKKLQDCKITVILSLLLPLILFTPLTLKAQVVPGSTIDLRSSSGHRWWFRPGDSPVIKDKETSRDDELSGKTLKRHELAFAWAKPDLSPEELKDWYDNFDIQAPWTQYMDRDGNRPFGDFDEYFKKYKGYGWYRTEIIITKNDIKKKFNSKSLVVRLGKIGQANAAYFNGRYIGGDGLKHLTKPYTIRIDKKMYYDRSRYYELPRDLVKIGEKNVIAVRVSAKYNISPGLAHGNYYLSSARYMERTRFWDDFKKIFIIALSMLLGIFYIYWQVLFRENDRASIYFALASFSMAVNTFARSDIIYDLWNHAFLTKRIEFVSFILFAHLVLKFIVHFSKIETGNLKKVNVIWDLLGIASVIGLLLMPNLMMAREFMFFWGIAPAVVFVYLIFIILKARKVPSMATVGIGFGLMALFLFNDFLGIFNLTRWELELHDYGFAVFGLTVAASIVSNMKKSRALIEKQKKEKEHLSKYFSPSVMDLILDGKIELGGTEMQVFTLFADIVGFTTFSEGQTPAVVVERLNEIFTRLSGVIRKYNATLDKYIGDCIMAFWGAPVQTPDDAYNAVTRAVEMQDEMTKLNEKIPEGQVALRLRVGINYGPTIFGNIGSSDRMDFTVIGDAVNTASRIESNGFPGRVAISESTFIAAGGEELIDYSEIKEITVKGKAGPVKIYLVNGIKKRI